MSHPWSEYPTLSRDQLLARLTNVARELSETYTELGYTQAEEFKLKADQWFNPREPSVTGRQSDTHYAAVTQSISIIELECRVKSMVEEKLLILKLLEHARA
jgi:hypothetical protein